MKEVGLGLARFHHSGELPLDRDVIVSQDGAFAVGRKIGNSEDHPIVEMMEYFLVLAGRLPGPMIFVDIGDPLFGPADLPADTGQEFSEAAPLTDRIRVATEQGEGLRTDQLDDLGFVQDHDAVPDMGKCAGPDFVHAHSRVSSMGEPGFGAHSIGTRRLTRIKTLLRANAQKTPENT